MAYASDCRTLLTRAWKRETKDEPEGSQQLSPNLMHTAFNIALFPLLFFFSGLFYTDVLSTCVVLRMYRLFLQRKCSVWLYMAGILTLTMRQTNIFWVAIYMGGMEVVKTFKVTDVVPKESAGQTWNEIAISNYKLYSRGEIHDIPLKDAELYGKSLVSLQNYPLMMIRFCTLCHEHCRCGALPPHPRPAKALAIHRTSPFICRLRILERWRRSWYIPPLFSASPN